MGREVLQAEEQRQEHQSACFCWVVPGGRWVYPLSQGGTREVRVQGGDPPTQGRGSWAKQHCFPPMVATSLPHTLGVLAVTVSGGDKVGLAV